jgi:uncharacterized protein
VISGAFRSVALAAMLVACRGEQQAATPSGPVVDAAGIIPAETEAALDVRLRTYWDEEETAIVVSTTDSLDGRSIEEFARDQFREWGIGNAETNRGVLVLVAPDERKARIEVGCGLETVLTNAVAQDIMDEEMTPRFRTGELAEGIEAGVTAIATALAESEVAPGPVSPYCVELMREAA